MFNTTTVNSNKKIIILYEINIFVEPTFISSYVVFLGKIKEVE